MGEEVIFAQFEGGRIETCVGTFLKSSGDTVVIKFDDKKYRFIRTPGAKCGWGRGQARFWRLSDVARRRLCLPDYVSGNHFRPKSTPESKVDG